MPRPGSPPQLAPAPLSSRFEGRAAEAGASATLADAMSELRALSAEGEKLGAAVPDTVVDRQQAVEVMGRERDNDARVRGRGDCNVPALRAC